MAPSPYLENSGLRFAPYIRELKDFLNTRGIRSGASGDLMFFANRLENSPALHEAIAFRVRSIRLREGGNVTHDQLIELLLQAAAGLSMHDAVAKYDEAVARISAFVTESLVETPVPPEERLRKHLSPRRDAYEHPPKDDANEPGRARPILIGAVTIVVVSAALFYLTRPSFPGMHLQAEGTTWSAAAPGKALADCVGTPQISVQPSTLAVYHQHVATLKAGKHREAALSGLKDIVAADPAFPGIQLEISNLALDMGQPQQAMDAVSSQIAISECFAKLSPTTLESYCANEFPYDTVATCRSRLAQIRAEAQLQATLVTQTLSRNLQAASTNGSSKHHSVSSSPHHHTQTASADQSLVKGQGTDLDLGAYSKPQ